MVVDLAATLDTCFSETAHAAQDLTDTFPVNQSLIDLGTKSRPKGFCGKFAAEGKLRLDETELQKQLLALQARMKCRDCG